MTAPGSIALLWSDVFPGSSRSGTYLTIDDWTQPVQYFVGPNGSGKSRAAKLIGSNAGAHVLTTDRLNGLMSFAMYPWGVEPTDFKGVSSDESQHEMAKQHGASSYRTTVEGVYALREQPEVLLRVTAFIRRALGRMIDLRERDGFLDPSMKTGEHEYSLFRDEGHGLRELVILLTAIYRKDWSLLVVDEPELHLHPSMARLWITELLRECGTGGRRAVVVTHQPELIEPKNYEGLSSVWSFAVGREPRRVTDSILDPQRPRIATSLARNPRLVSQLVFSPRPVLVEGPTDVAALTTATARTQPPEATAQTDFVECGGSSEVALWLEVCTRLHLDVRAVADLDALFSPEVRRAMESRPGVDEAVGETFTAGSTKTSVILRPLIQRADRERISPTDRERARWLSELAHDPGGLAGRRDKLLEIWRQHGLWLHPQGDLEKVLGLGPEDKHVESARRAAGTDGPIDDVVAWAAYSLDAKGDVLQLLNHQVEIIAHDIMEVQGLDPHTRGWALLGGRAEAYGRLVEVEPHGEDAHRITVKPPEEYAGYWTTFSRETPTIEIILREPRRGPDQP